MAISSKRTSGKRTQAWKPIAAIGGRFFDKLSHLWRHTFVNFPFLIRAAFAESASLLCEASVRIPDFHSSI